jgi:hypothetical protein
MNTWKITQNYTGTLEPSSSHRPEQQYSLLEPSPVSYRQRWHKVDNPILFQLQFDERQAILSCGTDIIAKARNPKIQYEEKVWIQDGPLLAVGAGHFEKKIISRMSQVLFPFEYQGDGPNTVYEIENTFAGGRLVIYGNGIVYHVIYGSGVPIRSSYLYQKVT